MYGSKLVIIVFILSIKNLVENVTIKSLMEVDNLSVCPENDKLESPIKNLKYVKINRTHSALSFDLPLIHPLGETTGIALERWANGGWVTLPFMTSQKNMCEKLTKIEKFREIWINVLKDTNITHPEKCPVPPGNYRMSNHVINLGSLKIPGWNGRFRAITKATDASFKRVYFCIIITWKIGDYVGP